MVPSLKDEDMDETVPSLFWQKSPVKPGGHIQLSMPPTAEQVPPFWHVRARHLPIHGHKIEIKVPAPPCMLWEFPEPFTSQVKIPCKKMSSDIHWNQQWKKCPYCNHILLKPSFPLPWNWLNFDWIFTLKLWMKLCWPCTRAYVYKKQLDLWTNPGI